MPLVLDGHRRRFRFAERLSFGARSYGLMIDHKSGAD